MAPLLAAPVLTACAAASDLDSGVGRILQGARRGVSHKPIARRGRAEPERRAFGAPQAANRRRDQRHRRRGDLGGHAQPDLVRGLRRRHDLRDEARAEKSADGARLAPGQVRTRAGLVLRPGGLLVGPAVAQGQRELSVAVAALLLLRLPVLVHRKLRGAVGVGAHRRAQLAERLAVVERGWQISDCAGGDGNTKKHIFCRDEYLGPLLARVPQHRPVAGKAKPRRRQVRVERAVQRGRPEERRARGLLPGFGHRLACLLALNPAASGAPI